MFYILIKLRHKKLIPIWNSLEGVLLIFVDFRTFVNCWAFTLTILFCTDLLTGRFCRVSVRFLQNEYFMLLRVTYQYIRQRKEIIKII